MSCDYTETNGARNDSLNMENVAKDRERVLHREEPFLNKTKMNLDRPMKRRIGSTITITRDSIETSRHLMNVGSRSCGLDLI